MLNSKQVQELFEKEAILIGNIDAVLCSRAEELFGKEAVADAKTLSKLGRGFGVWGINGEDIEYLYPEGFRIAATCKNLTEFLNDSHKEVVV